MLAASKELPTILCCHIPLVPLRDEEVLKQSFGFGSYTAHDAELLKLVDTHADSVVAVLSGHLHLTGVVRRNGVCHIVISGTGSYPCDFASYEVFADRIRMRVHSLPPNLVTPETDIHGKPRYATDFTDAAHVTHEAYVRGNPSERTLEMVLRRAAGRPGRNLSSVSNRHRGRPNRGRHSPGIKPHKRRRLSRMSTIAFARTRVTCTQHVTGQYVTVSP